MSTSRATRLLPLVVWTAAACGTTEVVVGDAPGLARVAAGVLGVRYEITYPDTATVGPATGQPLGSPGALAARDDGSFYFADRVRRRVGAVSVDGRLSWPVGRGVCGPPGPNGLRARDACLGEPAGLALLGDSVLLVADAAGHRVYRADLATGEIAVVLGTGTPGIAADGAAAATAPTSYPRAVAVGPTGGLVIAEAGNHRVVQVGTNGQLTSIAGTAGFGGDDGDGGAAADARLVTPVGLAWMGDTLYVADAGAHRIRRIARDSIRGYAGFGTPGFAGDRGPADRALFRAPGALAAMGTLLFVADRGNHRVRIIRVGADTLDTYGGTGEPVPGPDAYEIGRTSLAGPAGLAAAGRFVLVSDSGGYVVRRVVR